MNILETAAKNGNFKTFAAAVKAAGLTETLNGAGPFTVFAPTDAAFASLPSGTLDELLKPENKAKLTGILTYHVVSGSLSAQDLGKRKEAKSVQGEMLPVDTTDGVKIGGAKVSQADIVTSNGMIHVVDRVLMPH
jgi:uncharacterized surface protein with fasciclin (FAS1) repeats